MIASIFFTAPKLELAYQMASYPIQMTESNQLSFTRLWLPPIASRLQFRTTIFAYLEKNLYSNDQGSCIIALERYSLPFT